MPWQLAATGLVFADTSALFALAVRRDQYHVAATELQRTFVETETELITTNFVVAELHALILTRVGAQEANTALAAIDQSRTEMVRADHSDELRAREILRRFADHGYSLTDAISFAVMDQLAIRRAFTFDFHFVRYGINVPVET